MINTLHPPTSSYTSLHYIDLSPRIMYSVAFSIDCIRGAGSLFVFLIAN